MLEGVAGYGFANCERVGEWLIRRDTWLLDWGARLTASLAGQASVLPKFDTPVSKDTPPFSSLLRLRLDRRLAAGLGIELVDFAS